MNILNGLCGGSNSEGGFDSSLLFFFLLLVVLFCNCGMFGEDNTSLLFFFLLLVVLFCGGFGGCFDRSEEDNKRHERDFCK